MVNDKIDSPEGISIKDGASTLIQKETNIDLRDTSSILLSAFKIERTFNNTVKDLNKPLIK